MNTLLTAPVADEAMRMLAAQEIAVLNHIFRTANSKGVCKVRLLAGDHLSVKGVGTSSNLGRMVTRLDEAGHEVRVVVRYLPWPRLYLRVTRKNRAPWPARFKNP
jgi:hypothetical protein